MDNTANVWRLVARVLNGEGSSQEQQELLEILRSDESLQQQYDLLSRIWTEKESSPEPGEREHIADKVNRIINKADEPDSNLPQFPVHRKRSRAWLIAASVLVIGAGAWLLISSRTAKPETAKNENSGNKEEAIEAKKGSRTRSMLPDGTTVWLNAGSKLSYDDNFTSAVRNVRLEGEAFFDVIKDAKRPFIVHTGGIDIKVLGTAFNVKSYPEDKTVETTLYRGSVKVFRERETEERAIQLRPNEKLILNKEAAIRENEVSPKQVQPLSANPAQGSNFTIAHIDSTKKENERLETAWLYSRLEFRGDNFEELAMKLERWYNITITFTDEKVKQLSFNGSFESETVEQAFDYLKEANSLFTYKIKNHEISVGSVK